MHCYKPPCASHICPSHQSGTRLAGFEPAAHGLEVRCSIQLSYRRPGPTQSPWRAIYGRAGDGVRTRDIQLGRLTLCQLSYTRLLVRLPIRHPLAPCRLRRAMVGTRGFEPPTPCSQSRCATRLRHVPSFALPGFQPREYSVSAAPLTQCTGHSEGERLRRRWVSALHW